MERREEQKRTQEILNLHFNIANYLRNSIIHCSKCLNFTFDINIYLLTYPRRCLPWEMTLTGLAALLLSALTTATDSITRYNTVTNLSFYLSNCASCFSIVS